MAKITTKEKQIEEFLVKKKPDLSRAPFDPKPRRERKKEKIPLAVKTGFLRKKMILPGAVLLLVAILLGTSGYFYWQYKQATAADAGKNEATGYTVKISKFMILPSDETPTLATVADVSKLSSQPFFANAQNGDKVLFYTKAQKAILYRPSTNMIIDATSMAASAIPSASAPVPQNTSAMSPAPEAQNTPQAESQPSPDAQNSPSESATALKTAAIAIYNGTDTKGLAKTLAGKLSAIEGISVAKTGNAKGNFSKTAIIDLTGNNADLAQKIASTLNGEIGSLPDGETKPDADILIIAGNDAG